MRYQFDTAKKTEGLYEFSMKTRHLLQRVRMALYVVAPKEMRADFYQAIREAVAVIDHDAPTLQRAELETKLAPVGLTKRSLTLKLSMFDRSIRLFDEYGGVGRLSDVLEIANSILGSLAERLGIFAPLTELIDMILKMLELSETKKTA